MKAKVIKTDKPVPHSFVVKLTHEEIVNINKAAALTVPHGNTRRVRSTGNFIREKALEAAKKVLCDYGLEWEAVDGQQ